MDENALDEHFIRWFSGCFKTNATDMPPDQRKQLEMAYYAGASGAMVIERSDGSDVVLNAINGHIARMTATPTAQGQGGEG